MTESIQDCVVDTVEDWFSNNCINRVITAPQSYYNQLFNNFYEPLSEGIFVPGVNNPTDDQLNFQYLLGDFCNNNNIGGKCQSLWTERCSNYTRDDTTNPIVRQFCGCYLPADQYEDPSQRACDVICSGLDQVKYFETSTSTSPQTCDTNVCIIDDVTIRAVGSTVGDITFSQLCQNCGVTDCRCIISDINIISQDSQLDQLNLEQNCGGSVTCFANVEGQRQQVNCNQYLASFGIPTGSIETQKRNAQIYVIGFGILTLLLLILLIIGLYLFFR